MNMSSTTKHRPVQPCNSPELIDRPELSVITESTLITEYKYQLEDLEDNTDDPERTIADKHANKAVGSARITPVCPMNDAKKYIGIDPHTSKEESRVTVPEQCIPAESTSKTILNTAANNRRGDRINTHITIRHGYDEACKGSKLTGNRCGNPKITRANSRTNGNPSTMSTHSDIKIDPSSKSERSRRMWRSSKPLTEDNLNIRSLTSHKTTTKGRKDTIEPISRSRLKAMSVSSDESSSTTSCGEDSPRYRTSTMAKTNTSNTSMIERPLGTSSTRIRQDCKTTRSTALRQVSLTSISSDENGSASSVVGDSPRSGSQTWPSMNSHDETTNQSSSLSKSQSKHAMPRRSGFTSSTSDILDRTSASDDTRTSSESIRSSRSTSRPMSGRQALRKHHEHRNKTVVEGMRQNLHRRLRTRKERSMTGDDIFQRQLNSGFWTSEVLYHQWGNSILTMRNSWKDNSSQEFVQPSDDEEDDKPARLRSRRQAISVDRNRRSPLTMTTMSVKPIDEEASYTVPTSNDRRRSSELLARHRAQQSRSFSMDVIEPPIRLGMEEDPCTRRRRLKSLLRESFIKVRLIIRVLLRMIETSKASTYAGLMASLHFSSATPQDTDDPTSFNKDQYSRRYAELHVPGWAKHIARKDPWDRAPEEILRLYGVMRNMRSFEKFTRRMRMEICRAARYTECGKGRVIVRQGHVGHNFYFIHSGSVFVQIDIRDEATELMTTTNVNVLGRGTCFGELALLGDGHRKASIICRELTELFEIERETFHEVCSDIFDSELADKVQVVLEMPFFQSWPADLLRRLCFESPIQEVDFGKVVESDPGSSEYCYVVLKGKVTILMQCDLVLGLCQNYTTELEQAGKTIGSREAEIGLHRQCHEKTSTTPAASCPIGSQGVGPGEALAERLTNLLLPEWTRGGKCHMRIGLMSTGHSTDFLPLKFDHQDTLASMTLVSRGCRLLRISKQRIEKLAPPKILEAFKTRHASVLPTPSNQELFERFLSDVTWYQYRSRASKTAFGKISVDLAVTGVAKEDAAAALIQDERGRAAVLARLNDLLESSHSRNAQTDGEDGDTKETKAEADESMKQMTRSNRLKDGVLPTSFNSIKNALNI